MKQRTAEYYRNWRKNNPEKAQAYYKRYKERQAGVSEDKLTEIPGIRRNTRPREPVKFGPTKEEAMEALKTVQDYVNCNRGTYVDTIELMDRSVVLNIAEKERK